MKTTIICISSLFLLLFYSCTDRDVLDRKEGVSLPAVENLTLQQVDEKHVKLTWNIPNAIPEEMELPVKVFIEVKEVVNVTKTLPAFNTTLANAPTEFIYEVPDETKTYHLTVKLNGSTKVKDVNYSGNIYSLGQTVVLEGMP
ncbi:protein of unknown function [Olivibacter domesticus]|uniref:DUF4945 domain-containing protein n=2 Tax=Olivibacter domesticus TaxID=407022 RepID=A0A1H7T8D6_OLID1|nr:protein of unknown function [Olivibacter domesticus]